MKKRLVVYIVIVFVILAAIFLSRQPAVSELGEALFLPVANMAQDYLKKGSNWVNDTVYSKIGGEVEKRGDMIQEGINAEKEKVSQTIGEKIKEYFSGVVDSVFNPGKVQQAQQCPQVCPTAEPQAQP